jgi:hypothetical protein
MLTADDLRIRPDPGAEFAWHVRIWWQHADTPVSDADLITMRKTVGNIHDAVKVSGS